MDVTRSHDVFKFCPNHVPRFSEARHFTFRVVTDIQEY